MVTGQCHQFPGSVADGVACRSHAPSCDLGARAAPGTYQGRPRTLLAVRNLMALGDRAVAPGPVRLRIRRIFADFAIGKDYARRYWYRCRLRTPFADAAGRQTDPDGAGD